MSVGFIPSGALVYCLQLNFKISKLAHQKWEKLGKGEAKKEKGNKSPMESIGGSVDECLERRI